MKKTLLFGIFAAVFASIFTSCRIDNGTYTNCTCDSYNKTIVVDRWTPEYDSDGYIAFYTATFNVPQITRDIYANGSVYLWREYNYGYSDCYQRCVPVVDHIIYPIYDEANPNTIVSYGNYEQTTDYEFRVGELKIYVTNSDGVYDVVPDVMYFHLRITN